MKSPTIASTFEALLADLGSDASRRAYRTDWKAYQKWLRREKIAVLDATPQDVKRYVAHLTRVGKAQKTRGRALSVIRAAYGALVAEELLQVNPAREIKNTKAGRGATKAPWLEEDALSKFLAFGAPAAPPPMWEVCRECNGKPQRCGCVVCAGSGRLLKAASEKTKAATRSDDGLGTPSTHGGRATGDDELVDSAGQGIWIDRRDRMVIQLLAGTGRRRAEVARMETSNFSSAGVTGVVKGGAVKTAPVPTWLKREINEWCSFAGIVEGPLLPKSPEDPSAISGDAVYLIVKRVAAAIGVDPKTIAPHGFRRSLATLSERHGAPLRDIQAQLGHESQGTTEGYLHGVRKIETAPGEWMGELVKESRT